MELDAVVMLNVVVPLPVTVVGLKPEVDPEGSPVSPVTPKLTVPLKPFSEVIVKIKLVLPPGATVCVVGLADNVKSGCGGAVGMICSPFIGARR